MSETDISNSSPSGQHDWDSILAEIVKKLAARWPRSDAASVDSAANMAVAIVYAMVRNGTPVRNIRGLVWTIACHTLNAEHRRAYSQNEVTGTDLTWDTSQGHRSPEDILIEKEFQRALVAAILELPDNYAMPFVAHIVQGMSYEEIHLKTGIPPGTARNNVCKARKMVRAVMERQDYHE